MYRFSLLILLIAITGCTKNNPGDIDNPGVEEYIGSLLAGTYDSQELPEFSTSDIPALLAYKNDMRLITNFPRNPISSFYQTECRLGMYMLWTIESIRAVSIDSEFLIGRFPSQNPVLALRDSDELEWVDDEASQQTIARAYLDWWVEYALKNFGEFGDKDPLESTEYRWH